ncbi:Alpha-ketoglutarate-dependent taurine dioxygenase [Pseudocercospora fuligena]|uniref:Alpha-ketoglutarate-dependent taurine dioxygenase n=1 Tax=Pseudocercospora fuligena TaxID=685502 RepID=A0A8H6RWF0_9PEZI|nr:Alpha-ketoglutarate-dependent taurine dioxygenase [Pseudocercospora fuligena]
MASTKTHANGDAKSNVLTGHQQEPLTASGILGQYKSFDVTPVIGREFPEAQLKEWLEAPNADELLRDLAITISQRGVVFFRKQDDLDNNLQKQLIQRIGELSGKPSTSKLHIHPIASDTPGIKDDEISVISSERDKKLYAGHLTRIRQSAALAWHSDITFEPVPSDYAILRLTELPETGCDTLWASGYEVYDRISPAYQKFLEGLSATFEQPLYQEAVKNNSLELFSGERGAPENVGTDMKAIHPVIRTNPVTGWKSVFAVGIHAKRINEVTEAESTHLLKWFIQLITENHDLQVRYRWQNPGDVAIWDNRSVYHAATADFDGLGSRTGQRAVSLGERPYLDLNSVGRAEGLRSAEKA